MDIKVLLQALGRVWLIDEMAAYHYAELLTELIENKAETKAGLFDDAESPYRVNSRGNKNENGEVLVIPVAGLMMKNDFCGDAGTASKAALIRNANKASSISSIVLKMDTPGGTVDGTEDFSNAVAESRKPVVAFVEKAASAGYWVSSPADEIVLVGQTAMVGSIGTMASMRDSRKIDEKYGYKTVHVFASRSIDKNRAAMEALDGKPESYIKEILDPLNAAFESAVTNNRKGKVDIAKEDVLTGKVYFGVDAIKHGLADTIGSFDYAVKRSLQLAKTIKQS